MRRSLILGAGGFIGNHLVERLKKRGDFVRAVDLKQPEFTNSKADEYILGDLRDSKFCDIQISNNFDEVYQLAADMGGAGYIFTGENDFDVVHNSGLINLNVARSSIKSSIAKLFFSSSACVYPKENQSDPLNPNCSEHSAYPANPDSEYGWEKIFSERLYLSAFRNYGLNIRIARFHNIYGPFCTWNSGKEKAPAAICRKVAEADENGQIEIWGSGDQTRSFLYIDDCIDGLLKLMDSDCKVPVNIGSEEMVSINELCDLVINYSDKKLTKHHIAGPVGVLGRCSVNSLVERKIGWQPKVSLNDGIGRTFDWIKSQVEYSSVRDQAVNSL